jgi:hypothetical protein
MIGSFKLSARVALGAMASLGLMGAFAGVAHAEAAIPSHCAANEGVVFNARVGAFDAESLSVKGQKVVSLCADRAGDMKRLDYRYGLPGKVELSYSAPAEGLFQTEYQDRSRQGYGLYATGFARGTYRYVLVQCQGRLCNLSAPITLQVFNGKKRIARLHADFETATGPLVDQDAGLLPKSVAKPGAFGLDFEG